MKKEIAKAAVVSILSIGVLSTGFMGFNRLTFNAATSGATPLPYVETAAAEAESPQDFEVPNLTVLASELMNQHQNNVPSAVAMSMEEAANIGAEYIWDIFGECIDGMYVQMLFGAWASNSREYWIGNVFPSKEAMEPGAAGIAEAEFGFMIDAVTGMRVDIRPAMRQMSDEEVELHRQWRASEGRWEWGFAWQEKTREEQLTYLGVTMADIEPYLEIARGYAARHFGASPLAYETEYFGVIVTMGETVNDTVLGGISYRIEDSTGREALITIWDGNLGHILTQHNDIIPGFNFEETGRRGRG